jgi:4-amino-4-deoxy-L-arabinose transferase-like glycosyltransferase
MSNAITPKSDSQTDKLIVLFLGVLTVLLLLVTAPKIGLTWDEPTYMVAAETYLQWYGELIARPFYALSAEGIASYWSISHAHPPLSKLWSGFVWWGARRLFDDLTAHRLGNMLMAGGLVSLLFFMVRRHYGRTAGLVAAFALLTMPRFFFHAHLATIDVPVTAMIFAVMYVFWLGYEHPRLLWTLLLGLTWGLALTTKITALFVPPLVLFVWILLFRPRRYLFVRLAMMGLIGISFFIVSWPWLYHGLLHRLTVFIGFMTSERLPVEQYYFGKMYAPPPWHFPFVMTILAVPFSLILLATVGVLSTMRQRADRPLGGLFVLGAFVSLVIFTSGVGQVFDDERFMMPVFPYIAALAGIGFVRILQAAGRFLSNRRIQLRRPQLVAMMVIVTFVPHLLLAYDLYPHLLSYYSEVIGGAYGAKLLRLETTYWCDPYAEVLSYLNTHAEQGDVIWAECLDVLIYYQLHGQLRSDLQIAGGPDAVPTFPDFRLNSATFQAADYVVIQNRQSGFYTALRTWLQTRKPDYEFRYRELTLIGVYAK